MRWVSMAVCILGFPLMGLGHPDKAGLDVRPPAAKSAAWLEQKTVTNGAWMATLLEGAYFTLGTEQGLSSTSFDDDNTLTFGHPYAKTSYPILKTGGKWSKPADAAGATLKSLTRNGSELSIEYALGGGLAYRFAVVLSDSQPGRLTLISEFINGSSSAWETQGGLVVDPGLGWNGQDAWAVIDGIPVARESSANPSGVTLWERASGRKGVGLSFSWAAGTSVATHIANWPKVAAGDDGSVDLGVPAAFYDLALKTVFAPLTVPAGGRASYRVEAALLPPDPGEAFLRWDCPRFFTTGTGEIFPQDFPSTLKVFNAGTAERNLAIRLSPPYELVPDTLTLPVRAKPQGWTFSTSALHVRENYQADAIVPVEAQVLSGTAVLDTLAFNLLQPKSPFSDTGLAVTIDSVFPGPDGKLNLRFSARRAANGQSIFDLGRENIVLTQDGQKVTEFTLGKDTTGGQSLLDIVFILDVTGSMSEEITGVKNNIVQFGDDLSRKGIDFQIGMVTFLDGIETVFPMTRDVQAFKAKVGEQSAHGGGDEPENSLDALARGAEMQFRDKAKVMFIWITDATYHQADAVTPRTAGKVVETLLGRDIQVFCIGTPEFDEVFYAPIHAPTGGEFYDIRGNFQDILLDISGSRYSRHMLLSFTPHGGTAAGGIVLEVHHAGRGGKDTLDAGASPSPKSGQGREALRIACPGIPCDVSAALGTSARGVFEIYNLGGVRLHAEEVDMSRAAGRRILAGARAGGGAVKSGVYLFSLKDRNASVTGSARRGRILFLGRK